MRIVNVPPINTVIRASNALAIATPEVRRCPLANGVVIDVSKLPGHTTRPGTAGRWDQNRRKGGEAERLTSSAARR